MRRSAANRLTVGLVTFGLLLAGPFVSAVSNVCFDGGGCDINHPTYVNVFWDSSESQWNQDVQATDPSATVDRLDALLRALVHSRYFASLAQYHVTSVKMRAGVVASGCPAPPATIEEAESGDAMVRLVKCIRNAHPELDHHATILNVFLPPQTRPSTSDWCSGSGSAVARHKQYSYLLNDGAPPFVSAPDAVVGILPTNSRCNGTLNRIFESATHEMTEATTDPNPNSPSGWKTCCNPVQEVADQCEHKSNANVPFLFSRASTYFSNSANACVSGFALTAPRIASSQVCGTGSGMRISLTGTFGVAPFDLSTTPGAYPTTPASSRTMYLHEAVSGSHTWSAGELDFPADTVGLGEVKWRTHGGAADTIEIDGFDVHYGAPAPGGGSSRVSPGDALTVTVFSPDTGQPAMATFTAPSATRVAGLKAVPSYFWLPQSWLAYGDPTSVVGRLEDAGHCAIEETKVTVSSNDAPPATEQATSDFDGNFEVGYPFAGPAGKHTIKILSPIVASAVASIHPVADYLSGAFGDAAGHQPLTLHGDGYGPGTKVVFRSGIHSAPATGVNVPDGHTVAFATPPAPIAGPGARTVDVVAVIDGVESNPLSYTFVRPNQPVLSLVPPPCPWDANALQVDAYQPDGTRAAEQVTLAANYAAFTDASGAAVASITVPSGSASKLKGPGPVTVTATPAGAPGLAVTQTFALEGPASSCRPPQYDAIALEPEGPGPVESATLNAFYGVDGTSVVWAKGAAGQKGTYVLLSGPPRLALPPAGTLEVRVVGRRALAAAVRAEPKVYAHVGKDVAHVRFLGPGFSIGSKPGESVKAALRTPAIVSFALAEGVDPAELCIVKLAPAASSWAEVESSLGGAETPEALRGTVDGAGIYALARLEK